MTLRWARGGRADGLRERDDELERRLGHALSERLDVASQGGTERFERWSERGPFERACGDQCQALVVEGGFGFEQAPRFARKRSVEWNRIGERGECALERGCITFRAASGTPRVL